MNIRYIFRCPACRHVWALDYEQEGRRTVRHYERASDGCPSTADPGFDKSLGCPKCRARGVVAKRVKGRFSDKVRCDARCAEALGASCVCSCSGANHGSAHLPAKT